MAKTVLCYGDSNTYGYNPTTGLRYPQDIRWTGRLQDLLGEEYRVIEEGCNGRTTVFDDPIEGWKKGIDFLKPCLNSHKPVDIVILMLGSNDMKEVFHATAEDIANGIGEMVKVILDFTKEKQAFIPRILLVSPAEIGEGLKTSPFYGSFSMNSIAVSRELPKWYKKVADEFGCEFLNAAEYAKASEEDSLHFTKEAHLALAEAFAKAIRKE